MQELRAKLQELEERMRLVRPSLGVPALERRLGELRAASAAPGLWDDPEAGGRTMQELAETERELSRITSLEQGLADAGELLNDPELENETSLQADLERRLAELSTLVATLERERLFSGPYDDGSAYLSIFAGTGGTDAQDFAEMLLRMYLRFAEREDLQTQIQAISEGEEAGLKSVTVKVEGRQAYGKLRGEHGVHRLVRLSPFNAQNLRQTSFVLVDVIPILPEAAEIEIKDADLRIDVFRSSGAGGQSVNTTDSAVRVTHIPTGLVATSQNERSQLQNKEQALDILRARLARLEEERRAGEAAEARGETGSAEWGNQIRSYVLHPYQMVKDHRTGHETSDTSGVLDGKLQGFIDAYLSWSASQT
jgi:peptide chain release factor 2